MKKAALLLSFFCTVGLLSAPKKKPLLKLDKIKPIVVQPGSEVKVKVPFVVEKGFHVQSNPAAQKRLIATTLKLDANNGFSIGKVSYPKGKAYRMKGFKSDISVYANKFHLSFPIKVASGAALGKAKIEGKVRYQACNNVTCFFPKSIPVSIPLLVKKN